MTRWFRVEAPTFVAAVKVEDEQVIDTAPVLKWVLWRRDRSLRWLEGYCRKRRWLLNELQL